MLLVFNGPRYHINSKLLFATGIKLASDNDFIVPYVYERRPQFLSRFYAPLVLLVIVFLSLLSLLLHRTLSLTVASSIILLSLTLFLYYC